ncbi:MAG: DUF92 domain-containing protein [candidate division WOR-3 bacterium]|nr:DUF92 domain-containing protein [candidate division WOR-3 bacterium]MCX7947169.1 DUF92 domain-containing protein [candidate division WOR-3 bacterium]MDW8150225.1 DUF92 domain-containing protein [candidate division WOR-3 bacterium]
MLFEVLTVLYILLSIFLVQIIKDEFISRKILHILISIGIIISSYFISKTSMIVLCATFVVFNLILNILKLTKYDEKGNFGTILYPLAVLISTIIYYEDKNYYFLSLFAMFFSDPISAILGRKINKYNIEGKTLIGSSTFFLLTFLFSFLSTKNILFSLSFSLFLTAVEFILKRGLDNLFIVLFAIVLLNVRLENFAIAMFFGILISIISYRLNWLDLNGSIGTFIIGSIILYSGGFNWVLPLLLFLVLGSILSKLNDKKTKRNLAQVLANGGVSLILSILNIFYPNDIFYFIHLCVISAMSSDTFSTEIGMKFSKKAYLITNFKEVEKGTSGGISFIGFIGGIIGSFIISIFHPLWFYIFIIGIVGNLFDSIIGATLERNFILSNNMTNFISSSFSSVLGFLVALKF